VDSAAAQRDAQTAHVGVSALGDRRLHAAQASGGSSGGYVYSAFEKAISQFDLKGDALDFGAGVGRFTQWLFESGRFGTIVGADIMSRPNNLDSSIAWVCCDLNEGGNLLSESFDVILAAEIIEHLENPRAVARNWYHLLRPGGTLVLSTPNNESWRAILSLAVRGCFAAFNECDYPAHITALVRKDIQRILGEAGFDEPIFLYTNRGCLPRLGRITWQALSGGVLRGLRYSDNLLAIARRPNCAPGGRLT
jgi:2-polyprenyl-3-methyl-5-hydroxy-6-metoxy-1,4-benzoquinol methylase